MEEFKAEGWLTQHIFFFHSGPMYKISGSQIEKQN